MSDDDPYVETPPMTRTETIGWLIASAVMLYIMGLLAIVAALSAAASKVYYRIRR